MLISGKITIEMSLIDAQKLADELGDLSGSVYEDKPILNKFFQKIYDEVVKK